MRPFESFSSSVAQSGRLIAATHRASVCLSVRPLRTHAVDVTAPPTVV